MRILVTGAAGFIGMSLCERLLATGHEVIGIDSFVPAYSLALKEARWARLTSQQTFTGIRAEVEAPAQYFAALTACGQLDGIAHLAGQDGDAYAAAHPGLYVDANVRSMTILLDYAAHHHPQAKIVYAGADAGSNLDQPATLSAALRRACELIAAAYHQLHRLDLTGLRLPIIYGPWGRPEADYWQVAQAISAGAPLPQAVAAQPASYLHIDEAVDAIVSALSGKSAQPAYRIETLTGTAITRADMIGMLEKYLGEDAMEQSPGKPTHDLQSGLSAFARWFHAYYASRLGA